MRKAVKGLCVAAATTALLAVAVEVAARTFLAHARVRPADGAAAYFRALGTHPSDVKSEVALPGPKKGFRIVGVGDSTVKGFPYAPGLSFVSFLALGLTAATGTACDWEVVAVEGRSSEGVVANLDAAFACQPDLVVFYFGHNEFAHRISQESPFGVMAPGGPPWLWFGMSLFVRRMRDGSSFREAQDLTGMPPMFPYELKHGARLLAFGDPEGRTDNLPMDLTEIGYHQERFRANVEKIAAETSKRRVPFVFVEPTSSLLHPPLTAIRSASGVDAVELWRRGTADGSPENLRRARDGDAAPIRLTREGLDILRKAAGPAILAAVEDGSVLEKRYIDLVHPTPALAAEFAERVARALPPSVPRLDAADAAAVEKFRAACQRHLERSDVAPLLANGDTLGRQLMAQMHLEYGNRGGCEDDVKQVPVPQRTFGMVLLLDLALRWRGAAAEADAALDAMSSLHPDWKPSIDWWRSRVRR